MLLQIVLNSEMVSVKWLYLAIVIVVALMGIIAILVKLCVNEIDEYQIHYEKVLEENKENTLELNRKISAFESELKKLNYELGKSNFKLNNANRYKQILKNRITNLEKDLVNHTKTDNDDNTEKKIVPKKISRKKNQN